MTKCFADTNVLVYRKDLTEPSKQKKAQNWISAAIEKDALILSAQSLREYYWAALRHDRSPSAAAELRREIAALNAYVPEMLRVDYLAEAWTLQDRYHLSFWDSLLLASALVAGCTLFLSEDMNGGQTVGGLTIINPFTTAPKAVLGQ